jgi:V/A-type H+-transporting ATPase subunit E
MTTENVSRNAPEEGADAVACGVNRLVSRLREDGIEQGREEARKIIEQAEREAQEIREEARKDADAMLADAERETARLRQAAEDSVRVAVRDALLSVKEQLGQSFANMLRTEVAQELDDDQVLQDLIVAVAGEATESARIGKKEKLTIGLPDRPAALEDLRRNPESAKEGTLAWFVAKRAAKMLREGVDLQFRSDRRAGIRVRADERGVELALTDEDIADLLLTHLQPRFRALVEGLIRS